MRSLQARGRPSEAAREVRALLEVVRENEATVKKFALGCAELVKRALFHLKVLDAEVGEEALIEEVATPYTLHPTPYTLHPTPNTQHSTPFTLGGGRTGQTAAGVHPPLCACCASLVAPSELQQGPAGA